MTKTRVVIYLALASNVAIALAKVAAWFFTRSSSLLAEALHTLADTGNEILLLVGEHRSKRPPDEMHQFGHGNELYFWTLIVGLSMFSVGGLVSILEGAYHVYRPGKPEDPTWTFITLGVALLFEGTSLIYSYRQLLTQREEGESVAETVKTSKDPTVFMVVFEDGAAVVSLFIAFTAVLLVHLLGQPWIDGAGAIGVGLVLIAVALFLVNEIRMLLIGERADCDLLEDVQRIAAADQTVIKARAPRSLHFGPRTVMLAMRAEFHAATPAGEVARAIERMHEEIRRRHPDVKYIYVEPVEE